MGVCPYPFGQGVLHLVSFDDLLLAQHLHSVHLVRTAGLRPHQIHLPETIGQRER